MMPTCFGVIISAAKKEQQSASSAFGQVFFNIAGFFLAPNVSGYVMDQYRNPKQGLLAGYSLVLGWNVCTMIFLFCATCFSYREYLRKYSHLHQKQQIVDEESVQYDGADLPVSVRPQASSQKELGNYEGRPSFVQPEEIRKEAHKRAASLNNALIL